ncbi:HAD hydrolase-like protein [Agreia pratensis]|uniref:HAD family hydrolase n=1 Tax=Agreia pratensis TaxID=150121 RepID=UPI00188AAC80|nr:HAD family hydrolase [Agreia pratensis]MBF4635772.1 HAD hydrolase-like protein [Agreia pratensis]
MIRLVLFDLDGVIRHFDSRYVSDIEANYDLKPGTLNGIAFAKPLIEQVTTGRISRSEWVRCLGELARNTAAAEEWGRQPAHVDEAVLELSDEIRRLGIMTAVLTNGTDTIPAELAELDITHRFDAIFNSAEIGFAKPDVRAFTHVLDTLEVAAEDAFFTDDSASKIVGAESLSMRTHLFENIAGLRKVLSAEGVAVHAAPSGTRPPDA